ncbi:MAG TPA: glycosyltransferase family 39 protein [Acidimicrobiales bacterium]|nr:glycosyltransferase family 39 protein [Acidimicrobiales bacterium]
MRTLVGGEVDDGTDVGEAGRTGRRTSWLVPALLVGSVVLGVALRFVQRSPLWLDEALSVNIARLPVDDLLEALRHDGHPPLYYLLLHYWMRVFGEGDVAVRALSGVFAAASLPLAWVGGRGLAGRSGARWALVVVALSPYCVRYGTETRMYSLVMLLVLAGYLLVLDALSAPTWPRLVGIGGISGLLLLTHYWSFYLLAAVGLILVGRWWRRPDCRAGTARIVAAMAAGSLLFVPWLGGFLYQAAHTGTPWGKPFRPTAIVQTTLTDLGGGVVSEAMLYGSIVLLLLVVALFTTSSAGHLMTLDLRTVPTVRREMAVVALVVAIGGAVGVATDATYQSRYAAVVVPLVLLVVAVGITSIPGAGRLVAGIIYVGFSLAGVLWVNYYQRTQSAVVGEAVAARAAPGDVVVYCPDQLGPAYSREMPDGLVELAYPALTSPERVDWVDYAERNGAADPAAIAAEIRARAGGHAVFLVWMTEYQTFGQQCEQLVTELGLTESVVVQDTTRYYEPAFLHWAPATPPGG